MSNNDTLTRFLFEELGVRGEVVSLDASFTCSGFIVVCYVKI